MGRWRRGAGLLLAGALVMSACSGTEPGDDAAPVVDATDATDGTDGTDGTDETDGVAVADEDSEEMAEVQDIVREYPREETLFTSGQQWGPPSSWNPIPQSGEVPGLRGGVYEPLFLFDPWTVELEPWLAESGDWIEDDVFEVSLRDGLTWSDGETLDANDVVFTVELGQASSAVPWSSMWEWLDSVEAVDDITVRFTFSDPRYQVFENFLYSTTMLPEHIASSWDTDELVSFPNEEPIGSGALKYSTHAPDRMVWERNDDWWGIEQLGLDLPMRYIVDIVNPSNEVALGLLLQGGLDLSNNFLPGVATLVDQGRIQTFYDEEPYMLAANPALLVPNHQQEPTNDPEFRRALAFAIDTDRIVSGAYGNIVAKAHPSGMLPVWQDFWDEQVTAEHGFEHDPSEAQRILAEAGYEDTSGDGFVETPNGDPIELSLIVPAGWTDWMEAARVIAESAQAAGINVVAEFPDSGAVDDARTTGDFDLTINNWSPLSNTPWTFYNYLYNQPLQEQMWSGNFGRYENDEAWGLVEDLARAPSGSDEFQQIVSELQQIAMVELPMIPLWYNGLWAQYNTSVWQNWPTDDGPSRYYPSTWNGYWQFGVVPMLAELEPAS